MASHKRVLVVLTLAVPMLLIASEAFAIPAFARKYKVGCNLCHTVFPQLNRFGRDFRDNGFRMPEEVQKLMTPVSSHGAPAQPTPAEDKDFWSFTPDQIPFSIQGKLHGAINPKGDVKTDVQLEELQLQSGGTWTPRISYYLHQHLAEEGKPGDLYAGWVRFNNLFGSDWVNVTVGQFELPLSFSPEIERLSAFEYLVFDRELGGNPFNLNRPQLGIQIFGQSAGGTKLWAGAVNGSGLSVNETTEQFDSNSFKDVYARVGQEIGENFVGGFAYYGRASAATGATTFTDRFVRLGGDASVSWQRLRLQGTVLYGRDSDPLGTGDRRTFVGGFAEGNLFLNERTVALVRLDAIRQRLPAALAGESDEAAEEEAEFRVNTLALTPGLQFLVRPNVKVGFEYQIRQARRQDRGIVQLHISF